MNKDLSKILTKLQKTSPTLIQDVNQTGIIKRVPISSPQMSYMFSGGIPIGRIHRFRGPESSGKSTICNYLCGQLQKNGKDILGDDQKIIVYLDFERTFDKVHAEENGLICDDDHFLYLRPDSVEDACNALAEIVPTGLIAGIVLDSDAAAPSSAQMTNEVGRATFGGSARVLGEMLRKFNILCANYKTTIFWISQERANMQPMSHLPAVTGGFAPNFYSTTINRVTKRDTIVDNSGTIGIEIRVRNYKNKAGVCFRDANMKLYFKGGFDTNAEYLDFMISLGLIKQGGAWFNSEEYGFKLNGRAKVQEWLDNHEKERIELQKKVDELLTKQTVLDDNLEDPSVEETESIPDDILESDN